MFIQEKPRNTEVFGDYDVCVCGAGPAGVAAALSAARNGAKTCLLESTGCLGGIWTSGLLAWFLDYKHKGGIMKELLDKLAERGARGRNPSGTYNHAADVEELKLLLEDLCLEAGVDIHLHPKVVAANMDGRIIRHAIVENPSGRLAFGAKTFIDCTGNGDFGVQAGNRFDYAERGTGRVQPMSFTGMLTGLHLQDMEPFLRPTDRIAEIPWHEPKIRFRAVMEAGGYSPSYANPTLMPVREDLFLIQANHEYGFCGFKETDVTKATLQGRRELMKMTQALRSQGGIWKNVRLVATPEQIGVREGRRLTGRYMISDDDIRNGASFEDAVCHVYFGIDVHSPSKGEGKGVVQQNWHSQPYDIPMRSLQAADVDNLLMAGRCISGDFLAHSSYRVTGNAVAMGEGAGYFAATGKILPPQNIEPAP